MSQSRVRKCAGGDGKGGRSAGPRMSDDSVTATTSPKPPPQRSRSKNKIPKSVRYDLENALLSLCDVWFDEIKPHLVANGIKLHVQSGAASGDHAAPDACPHLHPGAASDHLRRQGASSAGFCPTQRTTSRAPCRRPPPLSFQTPQQSDRSAIPHDIQNHHHNYEKQPKSFSGRRRRYNVQAAAQQPNWRVPRLCRTYSLLPAALTQSVCITKGIPPSRQQSPPSYHNYTIQSTQPRRKVKPVNMGTQTETLHNMANVGDGNQILASHHKKLAKQTPPQRVSPDILASSVQKSLPSKRMDINAKSRMLSSQLSPQEGRTKSSGDSASETTVILQNTRPKFSKLPQNVDPTVVKLELCNQNHFSKRLRSKHHQQPACPTDLVSSNNRRKVSSPIPMRRTIESANLKHRLEPGLNDILSPLELNRKPTGRTQGTTAFFPSRGRSRHRKVLSSIESPLFREDLINIIVDKRDKRIKDSIQKS